MSPVVARYLLWSVYKTLRPRAPQLTEIRRGRERPGMKKQRPPQPILVLVINRGSVGVLGDWLVGVVYPWCGAEDWGWSEQQDLIHQRSSSTAVPHHTVGTRIDQHWGPHVGSWCFIKPRGWCARA
jgi:hypothetical protein